MRVSMGVRFDLPRQCHIEKSDPQVLGIWPRPGLWDVVKTSPMGRTAVHEGGWEEEKEEEEEEEEVR